MDDAELQRRKDLCTATIERIARDIPAQRPAPTIRYVDKLSAHGRFVADKNEIQIGIVGDLGDPDFTDGMIEALAAHEMGHWADPTTDATMRRSQIVCNTPFALGVLAGIAIIVHAAFTTDSDQVFVAVAAIVIGVMLQVALSPFFDWEGEFFADRFAAEWTSPDKVVALLTRFGTRWMSVPSPTHPSRAGRVRGVMHAPVSVDVETQWRNSIQELAALYGQTPIRRIAFDSDRRTFGIRLSRGGKLNWGAKYSCLRDTVTVQHAWIVSAGLDPGTEASCALLTHELGHRRRRTLIVILGAAYVVGVVAIMVATYFLTSGTWQWWLEPEQWRSAAGEFLLSYVLVTFVSAHWWLEFDADSFAADALGSSATISEFLSVYPNNDWPGFTHPSPAMRVRRQEKRIDDRDPLLVAFESDLAAQSLSYVGRARWSGKSIVGSLASWGVSPFEPYKRGQSIAVLILAAFCALLAVNNQWVLLACCVSGLLLLWVVVSTFALGWVLRDSSSTVTLRIVPCRAVPGTYAVKDFVRYPFGSSELDCAAEELVSTVRRIASGRGVQFMATAATGKLGNRPIEKYGFERAPEDVSVRFGISKRRTLLLLSSDRLLIE